MSARIPVAVLGATGSVGQRFVTLLARHPWFEVVAVAASDRSAGRAYAEAARWVQPVPLPEDLGRMIVSPCDPDAMPEARIAFSSLDARAATEIEVAFARAGRLVVSNAKSYRMHPQVPLMVPEINASHLQLVEHQEFGDGAILANPNCSTIGLTMALKPLADAFGVESAHVVTMQALSGAGLPGVPGMQVPDNIIPFIGGEEDKLETETQKILGGFEAGAIAAHPVVVSAHCNRVAVSDGHSECVSIKLGQTASEDDLIEAWTSFEGEPQKRQLPSAPRPAVHYLREAAAPQPRLHRDLGGGMAISVGRVRPCPLLDFKFATLSHNTIRGAAGGAILVAEMAVADGVLGLAPPAGV